MVIAKFEHKGNEYDYNGVCKVKVGDSWIDAVMYSEDGNTYVRELLDFMINFKCIEAKNPMPGDPWLRRQKTVADIIEDQLGPGYVARGHEGGKPMMVKEVECEDAGRDLVVANDDDDDPNISKPWSDNRQRVSIEPYLSIH